MHRLRYPSRATAATRRLARMAVLRVFLVVAVGCGGDDDASPPSTTTVAASESDASEQMHPDGGGTRTVDLAAAPSGR